MMGIKELRELNKREFAVAIKNLSKKDMIQTIKNYGVFVSSSKKTSDILEILLDCVDAVIEPSEADIKKIEKSKNTIKLTDEDKEVVKEAKEFLKINNSMYAMLLNSNIAKADEFEKEIKQKFRKLSIKLHTDTASAGIKKYHKDLFTRVNSYKDSMLQYITTTKENKIYEDEFNKMYEESMKNEHHIYCEHCKKDMKINNNIDDNCPF